MMISRLGFLPLLIISLQLWGQTSPETRSVGKIDKGKWQKLERNLRKSLTKDSLSPETRYRFALFYFDSQNPAANLDSAYYYSKSSIRTLTLLQPKDREKLKRIPLDTPQLNELITRIDSASFEKAKKQNTEASYQYFIDRHPAALEIRSATELRDEVAFLEAMKSNRWEGFQKFMNRYPGSHRKEEAQRRYDKLLYEDKTKDQRLTSYVKFNAEYPASPYAGAALKNIFELSTVGGSPESFQWFIQNFPSSRWTRMARNILYNLSSVDEDVKQSKQWMTDSLKNIEKLNASYWIAIYKAGLFGFIDDEGQEMISPQFETISDTYRCGDIQDRVLVTSSGLIARNGKMIYKGKVTEAKESGLGYILISTDSGKVVMHESGFYIDTRVENMQVLANRYVSIEKGNKWALFSLIGKPLSSYLFEDVSSIDSVIVLVRNGKKILTTPSRLPAMMARTAKEGAVVDDIRRWGDQQYWVRNGVMEGVIDARLNFVIPLDRQVLRKTSFGFLRGKEDKVFIKGIRQLEEVPYKMVQEQGEYIHIRTAKGKQQLYDKGFRRLVEGDSAWFQGRLAFLQDGDSIQAYLPSGQTMSLAGHSSFQFKEFGDSAAWLVLEDKKKRSVYDAASGLKLFTMEFDQIEAVAPDAFLITRLNKKGLVGEDGKVLVPVEYDAIVGTGNGTFSLLKEKKFGWYDGKTKVLIKPAFDRNIKPYSRHLRVAFQEKGYGFIFPDGKPLGTFEFEEIQYWNDSTALVKKNFQWMLLAIYSHKIMLDRIRSFSTISETPAEKIYLIHRDNAYGVLSNRRGSIVPVQYSDIVNLGTKERPLYFTERHIEEAGISVVVYYDHAGKIIRRQAMEADEFERIYCDN